MRRNNNEGNQPAAAHIIVGNSFLCLHPSCNKLLPHLNWVIRICIERRRRHCHTHKHEGVLLPVRHAQFAFR